MADWMKWVTGAVVLVGTLWTGAIKFDQTYARAANVQQQVDGLKALYYQQQVMSLEREEFELTRESQRRRLSDLEAQRLHTVKRMLEYLRSELKGVAP